MEKILLTVKDTAHALSMSPQTIYNRISRSGPRGFLKPRYHGSKPMFLLSEVEAYAKNLPTKKKKGSKKRKDRASEAQ